MRKIDLMKWVSGCLAATLALSSLAPVCAFAEELPVATEGTVAEEVTEATAETAVATETTAEGNTDSTTGFVEVSNEIAGDAKLEIACDIANLDYTYYTFVDGAETGTGTTAANGRCKVLVFGSGIVSASQETWMNITQSGISDVDFVFINMTWDMGNNYNSFIRNYDAGTVSATYFTRPTSCGKNVALTNYANTTGLKTGNVDPKEYPYLVYIDANNKIKYMTMAHLSREWTPMSVELATIKSNLSTYCGWVDPNAGSDSSSTSSDSTDTTTVDYQTKYNQTNAFIRNAYLVFLGRETDEGGRVYWLNGLMSGELDGASFLCGIFFSDEFKALNYDNDTFVKKMYKGMFNRDWDASGYNDWMRQLEAGADRFVVIRGFVMSNEYYKMCEGYDIDPGNFDSISQYGSNSSDAAEETTGATEAVEGETTASGLRKVWEEYGTAHVSISEPSRSVDPTSKEYALTSEFVKRFYTKGLKRNYDQAGLEDWTTGLQNGSYTAANIAVGFFHSPEFLGFETTDEDFVERLYQVYLGRASDPSGKADFLNQLSMGYSRDFIMYRFIYSPEFSELCESYGIDLGEYYVY